MAYDPTAYGRSVWLLHRTVLKNVDNGSLEVVLRGTWSLLSNLEITIIDAAVIDGAKIFRARVLGNKDCRFWRNLGVRKSNELVMWVEQNISFKAISGFMLTHSLESFSHIGINEPKHYVLRGEFVFEALHLRNVTIGDGAVGCDKKENNGLRTGGGKACNRLTIHVVTVD